MVNQLATNYARFRIYREIDTQSSEKGKKAEDLDEALMHSVRYTQKDSQGDSDIYLLWG